MGNDPVEKARASLGEAWRAAKHAAEGVKKEIERAGISRSIEDAGREIARATTHVASHLGAELEELGREIREKAEGAQASAAKRPPPPDGRDPEAPGDARPSGGSDGTAGGGAAPGGGGGVRIATD
jgi:hypothetical protein